MSVLLYPPTKRTDHLRPPTDSPLTSITKQRTAATTYSNDPQTTIRNIESYIIVLQGLIGARGEITDANFQWRDAFSSNSHSDRSLKFECAAVCFNLAAEYMRASTPLGPSIESRSQGFSKAAAIFVYIKEHIDDTTTTDMEHGVLYSLALLARAQAQEVTTNIEEALRHEHLGDSSEQCNEAGELYQQAERSMTNGSLSRNWQSCAAIKHRYYKGRAFFLKGCALLNSDLAVAFQHFFHSKTILQSALRPANILATEITHSSIDPPFKDLFALVKGALNEVTVQYERIKDQNTFLDPIINSTPPSIGRLSAVNLFTFSPSARELYREAKGQSIVPNSNTSTSLTPTEVRTSPSPASKRRNRFVEADLQAPDGRIFQYELHPKWLVINVRNKIITNWGLGLPQGYHMTTVFPSEDPLVLESYTTLQFSLDRAQAKGFKPMFKFIRISPETQDAAELSPKEIHIKPQWVLKLNNSVGPMTPNRTPGKMEWKLRWMAQDDQYLRFYQDPSLEVVLHDVDLAKCLDVGIQESALDEDESIIPQSVMDSFKRFRIDHDERFQDCSIELSTRSRTIVFLVMRPELRAETRDKIEIQRKAYYQKRQQRIAKNTRSAVVAAVTPRIEQPETPIVEARAPTRGEGSRKRKRFVNRRLEALDDREMNAVRESAMDVLVELLASHSLMAESVSSLILRPNKDSALKRLFKWGGNSKKDPKEIGVFGVNLELFSDRMQEAQMSNHLVPPVVYTCINQLRTKGMDTQGIFRQSGSAKRIESLRNMFDQDPLKDIQIDDSVYLPHDIAGVLKLYLRELPEPLLTMRLYKCFIAASSCNSIAVRQQLHRLLLTLLPNAHRAVLEVLLRFLSGIGNAAEMTARSEPRPPSAPNTTNANSAGTLMTYQNLALVIAPNILREEMRPETTPGKNSSSASLAGNLAGRELLDSGKVTECVRQLISGYNDAMWIVPSELIGRALEKLDLEREDQPVTAESESSKKIKS